MSKHFAKTDQQKGLKETQNSNRVNSTRKYFQKIELSRPNVAY